MYQVIIVFHVIVGLTVIGLVLMQQGKGADAGAAFGSGASGTIFGARGSSSFLSRTTAVFATLFFATSLGLAVFGGKHVQPKDIIMEAPAAQGEVPVVGNGEVPAPAVPAAEQPPIAPQAPVTPQLQAPVPPTPEPAKASEVPTVPADPALQTSPSAAPKQ